MHENTPIGLEIKREKMKEYFRLNSCPLPHQFRTGRVTFAVCIARSIPPQYLHLVEIRAFKFTKDGKVIGAQLNCNLISVK